MLRRGHIEVKPLQERMRGRLWLAGASAFGAAGANPTRFPHDLKLIWKNGGGESSSAPDAGAVCDKERNWKWGA